jgi:hypothetical protein
MLEKKEHRRTWYIRPRGVQVPHQQRLGQGPQIRFQNGGDIAGCNIFDVELLPVLKVFAKLVVRERKIERGYDE